MRVPKSLRWAGTACLVVVAVLCIYYFGGPRVSQNGQPNLSSDLEARLNSGATTVDFGELFPGTWDRMHVYPPSVGEEEIARTLGKIELRPGLSQATAGRALYLVVFERGGEEYGWYQQSDAVDLSSLAALGAIARQDARFSAVRSADGKRWQLVPEHQ